MKLFFPTSAGRRGRRAADGVARLHAAPLRSRGQYARDRVRSARRRPGDPLGRAGAPGQTLRIGGPRGSFIIPTNFDWHLLIGDDTALPAIARRLEELPAGTRAVVLVEVDGPADQVALRERRRRGGDVGASQRRRGRHHRRAGASAQDD